VKTETVIKKTKSKINQRKINIKRLAHDYADIPTKDTAKENSIIKGLKAEKKKKNELEHLVKRMKNRKKTIPTMIWKRNKSLRENILANLDKK